MSKTILILDDDPDFVLPLVKRLGWEGYTAIVFYKLKDFLDKKNVLKQTDLVLCDFNMPGKDKALCWQVVAGHIKGLKFPPPLFLMSGFGRGNLDGAAAVKQFKLAGYLQKPFDFEILKQSLAQIRPLEP